MCLSKETRPILPGIKPGIICGNMTAGHITRSINQVATGSVMYGAGYSVEIAE